MVLIASNRLRAALRVVPAGFFFELVDGDKAYEDQKVVLAVKMPSHRTRYLYLGAPAYLSVRRIQAGPVPLLWTAFSIEDDPHESFYLQRVVAEEDRERLLRLFRQDVIEIHVFNEINRCTASFYAHAVTEDTVLDALAEPVATEDETSDEAIFQCTEKMYRALSQDGSAAILKQIKLAVYQKDITPHFDGTRAEPGPVRDPERPDQASELHISNQGMGS